MPASARRLNAGRTEDSDRRTNALPGGRQLHVQRVPEGDLDNGYVGQDGEERSRFQMYRAVARSTSRSVSRRYVFNRSAEMA
jgi:hypothetical protein